MSGYGKRKRNRHANKLIPSRLDIVLLGAMVEERFVDVVGLHQRLRGTQIPIPLDIKPDVLRWREMRNRHKCPVCNGGQILCSEQGQPVIDRVTGLPRCACGKGRGDYRHKESEKTSTRIIAEWTVQVNMALRGQPDPPSMQWAD